MHPSDTPDLIDAAPDTPSSARLKGRPGAGSSLPGRQKRTAAHKPRRTGSSLLAVFVGLILLITVGVIALTVSLVSNPRAAADLFPGLREPTPTLYLAPTVPPVLPPTWTPSPVPAISATPSITPTATWTPFGAEAVGVTIPPDANVTPSPTGPPPTTRPRISYPFESAGVRYETNSNGQGCNWMSIAGQVFDMDGNPLYQVGVMVEGQSFEQFSWAGSATTFGPSGYEVQLNTSPYAATWTVRLLNFNTLPISARITVRSRGSCSQNVIILDFQQVKAWNPQG